MNADLNNKKFMDRKNEFLIGRSWKIMYELSMPPRLMCWLRDQLQEASISMIWIKLLVAVVIIWLIWLVRSLMIFRINLIRVPIIDVVFILRRLIEVLLISVIIVVRRRIIDLIGSESDWNETTLFPVTFRIIFVSFLFLSNWNMNDFEFIAIWTSMMRRLIKELFQCN